MLTLLSDNTIDELMRLYVNCLVMGLGGNLSQVILYGSCARGEHEIGSDIDVFILVKESSQDVIDLIRHYADKIDWRYDTLISNTIRSRDSYDRFKNESLYRNIQREGKIYYGAA